MGEHGGEAPVGRHPEPDRPHRIVSLIPAATGILAALGAEASLVAVGQGDPSPAARGVESVGSILAPGWERVVALEPTLVVVWSSVDVEPLRRALPDTVRLLRESIETVDDLEQVTRRLGAALGRGARAEALVAGLHGDGIGPPPCAGGAGGPTAAWIVSVDPIVVAGPSSWPGEVLAAAGVRAVPREPAPPWPTLSAEALAALGPELLVTAGIGEAGHARLRRLLPNSAIVPVDGDRFHVPSLDFASLAAELSALLAPVAATPLCTDPDTTVLP
jgi:iron complex transport system substrate-binding protein